ncbi:MULTISPECIES: hypothetical protein [unclassified Campylobacter]|nr:MULTISPECIES: hypothetical protein [unclassified Campylobacter]
MQTTAKSVAEKKNKDEFSQRQAVKKTMQKMEKELDKPAIKAVFERLKDK